MAAEMIRQGDQAYFKLKFGLHRPPHPLHGAPAHAEAMLTARSLLRRRSELVTLQNLTPVVERSTGRALKASPSQLLQSHATRCSQHLSDGMQGLPSILQSGCHLSLCRSNTCSRSKRCTQRPTNGTMCSPPAPETQTCKTTPPFSAVIHIGSCTTHSHAGSILTCHPLQFMHRFQHQLIISFQGAAAASLIAPGAVVRRDVNCNSVVAGLPFKI